MSTNKPSIGSVVLEDKPWNFIKFGPNEIFLHKNPTWKAQPLSFLCIVLMCTSSYDNVYLTIPIMHCNKTKARFKFKSKPFCRHFLA